MSAWLASATFFRRNKVLHAIAIPVVSAEHHCMVADLTGQFLLEQVPQRNFWKLGLSHAYRVTCEQISGCTIDVPFRCEFWVRLPGERFARCIEGRTPADRISFEHAIKFCLASTGQVHFSAAQWFTSFLPNPHMSHLCFLCSSFSNVLSHRHVVLLLSVLCSLLGVP